MTASADKEPQSGQEKLTDELSRMQSQMKYEQDMVAHKTDQCQALTFYSSQRSFTLDIMNC